ncbi:MULTISPECIES: NAD(P)H-quinone oxidoreductase [Nocardiopsis]|uniref:NAD(P)H quinone oxidoreductase, PIG3 family n=1 Tax=Nocardiopsis dassonvillei (strain ATCC 23218 / DSM 43111 / CIP 107115 / JCM 7437 / KCTC 9190 / NBRC 14626 / NCTC 10488 / NRRL B-5397 / IMRU 509) TaxID=446468 RepID=D7B8Z6_NOCDD|nr:MULTISPECIES: NAD(P)H-quinone oxidoreductase [Nocardiopsis]ADH70654.1 NAD(P)H quinone oxidoreductase, PIG3 family [Nocardiopsis dassonvillei subsp. dassonvillei DSM 43111]NKY77933.1 NAD(P)H-quinone oxidoreductase [Nocardiopsis dassonvillei]VEI90863.1 Beta-ketoacyl-acyl-carrier-protein synthase I [Nocardiopsis dassonvillei]
MHAIRISEPGGPEVLAWTEVPDPVPGEGEVLVDVAASAANRADVSQRQGNYPPPPGASEYPGLECSGTVAALGPGTEDSGWSVGDRVCALLSGGGYAEKVAVPVGQLLPVPEGVDLVEAAALPEVACTVWSNLVMVGGLRAGETVLVHGGGSGIGTFAVQFARALGARVAVTAGSREKLERCRELGAEILINYKEEDFTERMREAGGADLVLDIMGGSYLDANLRSLATNGRLVIIALMGGRRAEADLGRMLAKRLSVHATTLRSRPLEEKAAIVSGVLEQVWPLVEQGVVRPVVDRSVPMRNAAEAHRVMETSAHTGKILLPR